ncbi:hypothetical protein Tco_1359989 [Tanacetum coccineum]
MSTSNQQTLADSEANERPPMLERGNYIPWESRFRSHVRHSCLMDEFDKFAAKEGESLEFIYERLTMLVNIMDRNNVRPIPASINTKFLNLSDQKFSTPTNNRLRTTSNTRNQAVIKDGRVDIQTKNEGYGGNGNKNAWRQNRTQAFNPGTRNDERNQIKPRVRDAKYFREQMLLARKDEAESNLNNEENDFLLENLYGEETMEELTATAVSEVNASSKVHEQLPKKAFKKRENQYLGDIVDLEEKPSSHERIVYKIGYKNPERLKKAIVAQPKMYDGEMLHSAKLNIDSPDLEETLEDEE